MQRSTVLSLLLGCTVAAVVGWIWLVDDGVPVTPPGGTDPDPPHSEGVSSSEPVTSSVEGAVPPDAPLVTMQVTSREAFVSPPPAVLAEAADGVPLPARVVAGVGSGFDVRRASRGTALLAIEYQGRQFLRQLAVDPGTATRVRIGARIVVPGKILDEEQKPLKGASVWFGEREADGSPRSFPTDQEGAFEADVPAGDGVPFVVRADGRASRWSSISVDRDVQPLEVVMQRAATVYVQVAARAVEIERARAFVVPGSKRVSAGLSQWPFFAQLLGDGYPIDASGKAQIDDLPQNGEVGIVVRHPLAALAAPTPLRLSMTPAPVLVRMSFGERRHQGSVIDESGEAIAGAWVFARLPGQRLDGPRSLRLLPPYLDLRGCCIARAGADGAFSIGLPAGDGVELAVRAPGYAGRNVPWQQAMPTRVALPAWRGGDASLSVIPPVAGQVWRLASNLGGGVDLPCGKGEPCTLALPHCGRFDITLRVENVGEQPIEREMSSVLVTGPIEIPAIQ